MMCAYFLEYRQRLGEAKKHCSSKFLLASTWPQSAGLQSIWLHHAVNLNNGEERKCPGGDSNSDALRHMALNHACLPVPAPGLMDSAAVPPAAQGQERQVEQRLEQAAVQPEVLPAD